MYRHISREEHVFNQILSNEKPIQFSLTPMTFNWTCNQDNFKGNLNSGLKMRIWVFCPLPLLAIYAEKEMVFAKTKQSESFMRHRETERVEVEELNEGSLNYHMAR